MIAKTVFRIVLLGVCLMTWQVSFGQNAYYHPDDVKVPPGAVNPGLAQDEPRYMTPQSMGVWPGRLYWPRGFNDTVHQGQWKIYIKSWEMDPPNTIWLYIYNDSPNLQRFMRADIRVNAGWLGDGGAFWPESSVYLQDYEFPQGITRVPVNLHHVKGQIIHASLHNAHEVGTTKLIDLGD